MFDFLDLDGRSNKERLYEQYSTHCLKVLTLMLIRQLADRSKEDRALVMAVLDAWRAQVKGETKKAFGEIPLLQKEHDAALDAVFEKVSTVFEGDGPTPVLTWMEGGKDV